MTDESNQQSNDPILGDIVAPPEPEGGNITTPPQEDAPPPSGWAAPEAVPEQYRRDTPEATFEEMAKALKNAQEVISRGEHKQPAKVEEPTPTAAKFQTPEDVVKAAGLDIDKVAEAFATQGKLTDEQYAAFEKVGRSRAEVDGFYRGQAMEQQFREYAKQQAIQIAGGPEQFNTLIKWVNENLPADEHKKIDERYRQDPSALPGIVQEMQAKYNEQNGFAGSGALLTGVAQPGRVGGFGSLDELNAAKLEAEKRLGFGNAHLDPTYSARMNATNPDVYRQLF